MIPDPWRELISTEGGGGEEIIPIIWAGLRPYGNKGIWNSVTWFPTLDGNQQAIPRHRWESKGYSIPQIKRNKGMIPDPWRESWSHFRPWMGIIKYSITFSGFFIAMNKISAEDSEPYVRRSLRLHLIGTRGRQISILIFTWSIICKGQ